MADMTDAGSASLDAAEPGAHRVRLRGGRPRAATSSSTSPTLGAVVTKSIMLQPRSGRPTPRMAETPSGMLNSIGLQGPGIDSFLANDLAWLAEHGARTVVSIAGGTPTSTSTLARRLHGHPAVVDDRGQHLVPERREPRPGVRLRRRSRRSRVIGAVRRAADPSTPVFAKLSPDVTDIAHDRPRRAPTPAPTASR